MEIRIEHLRKEYPDIVPIKGVTAQIHQGDVISLIGPSGTGKSTLLRCINMLEKPTSGRIWLDDMEITDPACDIGQVRRRMGMVFQSFNLFGHLTVIENLMIAPMDLLGMSKQEAYDQGMRLLRSVGLAEKALNYPDELSGGQMQRVSIARTLAMDPDIILFDEPTNSLDPANAREVQLVIRDLAKSGKTMMIVTHEMNFARVVSNRIFFMDEGIIYEEGTPSQIFDQPAKENTRRFLHALKVLVLDITGPDYDFIGTVSAITDFCRHNQIPMRLGRRIELVFEEFVQQMLMPVLSSPHARVIVETAAGGQNAAMTVDYCGPQIDILKNQDDLSVSVLRGIISDLHFTEPDEEGFTTRMVIEIASPQEKGK